MLFKKTDGTTIFLVDVPIDTVQGQLLKSILQYRHNAEPGITLAEKFRPHYNSQLGRGLRHVDVPQADHARIGILIGDNDLVHLVWIPNGLCNKRFGILQIHATVLSGQAASYSRVGQPGQCSRGICRGKISQSHKATSNVFTASIT